MTETPCPLEVSEIEYQEIQNAEAVVIREYEKESDCTRTAKLVTSGDKEEMDLLAARSEILIVPVGFHIIAQKAVLVKDLIDPKGKIIK